MNISKAEFQYRLAHNLRFTPTRANPPKVVHCRSCTPCPQCGELRVMFRALRCFRCGAKDEELFAELDMLIAAGVTRPRSILSRNEIAAIVARWKAAS